MATDLSNWEQVTKNPNLYNKTTTVPIDHEKRRKSKRQEVRVQTNTRTGDYTVFASGTKQLGLFGNPVGQDIEIYSYDAEKNKYTVANDTYMTDLFLDRIEVDNVNPNRSRLIRDSFFDRFNSNIRLDTYNIAKSEADTDLEKRRLENLGNLKGYKSAANQSTTPPQTITNSAKSSGSSTKKQKKSTPNTDILNPSDNDVFSLGEIELSYPDTVSNFEYMRYPEGRIPNLGYDYIQITSYEYVAVGLPESSDGNYFGQGTSGGGALRKRESQLYKNPGDVIQLPMVGSISETNAVNWTDDTVNEINNIAAGIAYNSLSDAAAGNANPLEAVGGALMDSIKTVQTAAMSGEVKQAIAAYFAGQASGVPNLLQRAEGKMINNNLELLFNGPSLRTFNFAFNLRPRTKSEADLCRRIIRSLKKNSAPGRSDDFLFLTTPSIFRIQYIYNSDSPDLAESASVLTGGQREHPFMNKLKPCALIGLNVNYTPEGSYMTYEDGGSMTGYDLNLTFKEIEPIYKDDHEATPSESMGY